MSEATVFTEDWQWGMMAFRIQMSLSLPLKKMYSVLHLENYACINSNANSVFTQRLLNSVIQSMTTKYIQNNEQVPLQCFFWAGHMCKQAPESQKVPDEFWLLSLLTISSKAPESYEVFFSSWPNYQVSIFSICKGNVNSASTEPGPNDRVKLFSKASHMRQGQESQKRTGWRRHKTETNLKKKDRNKFAR